MKKLVIVCFVLMVMVAPLYAQVTPEEVAENVATLSQLKANVIEMRQVCRLYGRAIYGSIVLTTQQKADLITRYNTLKSATQTIWNDLL